MQAYINHENYYRLLSHSSFNELINFQYNKTMHHSNFIKMYLNQPNTSKILYFSIVIPQVFQRQREHSPPGFLGNYIFKLA